MLKLKVVSEFKGVINGVVIDRESVYYDMAYLLEDSEVFEGVNFTKDFIEKLNVLVGTKTLGDDWTLSEIEEGLSDGSLSI